MRLADLELDLDVFAGPFDLLLTLILREEVDLLEVDLAEIVISYIDHLERRGELDLEAATEFLVLIAALLELKSRLLLPGEEEELIELDPGEAAEELLARLLDAHRFRAAAAPTCASGWPRRRDTGSARRRRRHSCAGRRSRTHRPCTTRRRCAARSASCCGCPSRSTSGTCPAPKVSVAERLAHLRALLRRGSFSFDEAVERADRVTVAVTLFAVLELYKQGELTWSQEQPFGEITMSALAPARRRGSGSGDSRGRPARGGREALPLESTLESLLFLSPGPVDRGRARRRDRSRAARGRDRARAAARALRVRAARAGAAGDRGRLGARRATPTPSRPPGALLAKPRTPPLTPAQAETLAIVAYLQPVSRPEIARIRGVGAESAVATLLERGMLEEAGRSQFGAVLYRTSDLFLRLFGLEEIGGLPPLGEFDPAPELEQELRDRLLRAGRGARGNDAGG